MLREILPTLDSRARLAIHYRYWESMTIQEIARLLSMSWSDADRLIDDSILKLRDGFVRKYLNSNLQAA